LSDSNDKSRKEFFSLLLEAPTVRGSEPKHVVIREETEFKTKLVFYKSQRISNVDAACEIEPELNQFAFVNKRKLSTSLSAK